MLPDPQTVAEILAETAVEEILPRFQALKDHEIQEKESGELVTVADVAAEQQISRRLLDLLPGSVVVGEEAVAETPGLIDALNGDDPVWVIDPVDGTGNFAAGRPVFAVMTALVRRGEILASWIHDPVGRRTGVASIGEGAWLNGERLKVAEGGCAASLTSTLHAGRFSTPDLAQQIQARRNRLCPVKSLHCAGQEYLRLASGALHVSFFTKLMPWDHAPGVLIHHEAGGVARTIDGAPYNPARRTAPPLLLAPDAKSWQSAFQALFEDSPFDNLTAS